LGENIPNSAPYYPNAFLLDWDRHPSRTMHTFISWCSRNQASITMT